MTTITIQADEEIINSLIQAANRKSMTTDALVKEALLRYLQEQFPEPEKYSFIGIGHSGKGNISKHVNSKLRKAANRREGWSISE